MDEKTQNGKSVLVVCYSRTGNTMRVAEDIAAQLGADIERLIDKVDRSGAGGFMISGRDAMRGSLTELEPTTKDPSKYDLVIIGGPIWGFGHMTPAIHTYLTQNKGKIGRYAIFCTRWYIDPASVYAAIGELTGSKPVATLAFLTKEVGKDGYEQRVREFADALLALTP